MRLVYYTFLGNQNTLYSKPVKGLRGYGVCYCFHFNGGEAINEIYGFDNYVDLGERGVDTRLGRLNWSIDRKAAEYPSQSPYAYYANSPIWQIDYLGMGKESTHTDKDGKVVAVYDDGNLGIYKHTDKEIKSSKPLKNNQDKLAGHTLYQNSFKAGDKINFGSTKAGDWLNSTEKLIEGLARPTTFGKLGARLFYAANAGNGDIFDYKSKAGTSAGSQISPGVYASSRDVGNYLAGAVARITSQDKLDFMLTAGAFNLHRNNKLDLIWNISAYKSEAAKVDAPNYGEDEVSNTFQRLGYEGIKTLNGFNSNYGKIFGN